jgi:transcription elongation factor GreA
MKRTPMTARGAEALRAELKKLKSQDRPNIIRAIAEARGHGDLSENAEYHAAREQQGFIEGRIAEIEGKLANAEVIEPGKLTNTGRVIFGAVVELENQDSGERLSYQVVGEDEADIRAGSLHLDEFVIVQRACGFAHQGFREAGVAGADDRLERVRQPAQVLPLALGELGGRRCGRGVRGGGHGAHCRSEELMPHACPLTA